MVPTISRLLSCATLVAITAATVAGCTDASSPSDGAEAPTDTAATQPDSTHDVRLADGVEIPDSALGSQVQWVLDQLATTEGPDADTATQRFDDSFLEQIPANEVAAVFDQLRAAGPFTVTAARYQAQLATMTLDGADDSTWQLQVGIADDERINLLFLQAAGEAPEIGSWADLDQALADLGVEAHVFAAREVDGTWEPVHEANSDEPAPMGSIFKVYVLGAVQQAVLDGELSWDDELTVDVATRSLPSGELQNAEPGSTVTIGEAAEKMIAISDNTATDMLIDAVGRDTVEATVPELGHDRPQLLRPFPTTREFFWLGWGEGAGQRQAWADGDEDQRRDILAAAPADELQVQPSDITDVVWTSDVGWFASATDVADAHLAVQQLAADDETSTVRDLLAVNPGVDVDPDTWPYVAYKGGNAPGVFAMSWYLEDTDGVAHALTIMLTSEEPDALTTPMTLVGIAEQGIDLLAAD